ncbi:MAG: hypothetical protein NVSMB59_13570 [Vulcanimicrobiaceae bacterium]
MTESVPTPPAPQRPGDRVRSFLGFAFLISLLIHVVTLPFFGLKAQHQEKEEVQKISSSRKVRLIVPTPPPPTPTPPPPSPTPKPKKETPPPVKHTNPPPPQVKLKLQPPKTTSKSTKSSSEKTYVVPKIGSENGVPQGNVNSAAPATAGPVATGKPATAAPAPPPTAAPTPTPAPKPACANPNADATTVAAAEAEYPDIARQQGAVGSASVKVTLDAAGHVVDATINKSTGNASLDQSALKAARGSTYQPEVVNCVKSAGSYIFRVDFTGQ